MPGKPIIIQGAVKGTILSATIQDCIASVRSIFSDCEYRWIDPSSYDADPRIIMDKMRFILACEILQMLWIDWDYKMLSRPDLSTAGMPYFAYYAGSPHESMFYVNDCPWIFDVLMRRPCRKNCLGFPLRYLQDFRPYQIPSKCYQHLFYTSHS